VLTIHCLVFNKDIFYDSVSELEDDLLLSPLVEDLTLSTLEVALRTTTHQSPILFYYEIVFKAQTKIQFKCYKNKHSRRIVEYVLSHAIAD
jgi:CO dehydrogenase/acetyl-CoA synthase gamma subunit (corrinoid Fe-S protein)